MCMSWQTYGWTKLFLFRALSTLVDDDMSFTDKCLSLETCFSIWSAVIASLRSCRTLKGGQRQENQSEFSRTINDAIQEIKKRVLSPDLAQPGTLDAKAWESVTYRRRSYLSRELGQGSVKRGLRPRKWPDGTDAGSGDLGCSSGM